MNLKLNRPLCFFDIEATGIDIKKDRIVEISILKVYPTAKEENKTWIINPILPISKESIAIHGIKNEDVLGKPTFKEVAREILHFLEGSDLAGYNSSRFDIPMLAEEMLRADIDFDLKKHKSIDIQVIFHKMEPRTLSAAYKYYCQKELKDAHSSMADTLATYEIFKAQLEKYPEIKKDLKSLAEFSSYVKVVDPAGFVCLDKEGDEIFGFGKYKGKKVREIFAKDPHYYGWIQNGDFPNYTKKIITSIKLKDFNK